MYQIMAQVKIKKESGWTQVKDVPVFFLDENILGITNEDHAARIAKSILSTGLTEPGITVTASAVKMEG